VAREVEAVAAAAKVGEYLAEVVKDLEEEGVAEAGESLEMEEAALEAGKAVEMAAVGTVVAETVVAETVVAETAAKAEMGAAAEAATATL
jgi:hypothetical protein